MSTLIGFNWQCGASSCGNLLFVLQVLSVALNCDPIQTMADGSVTDSAAARVREVALFTRESSGGGSSVSRCNMGGLPGRRHNRQWLCLVAVAHPIGPTLAPFSDSKRQIREPSKSLHGSSLIQNSLSAVAVAESQQP
jgi:hypothetical protein